MRHKFEIGQFGRFVFTIRKKRNGEYYETPFDLEGMEVVEIDPINIRIRSIGGEVDLIVTKHRVKLFIPEKKPELV